MRPPAQTPGQGTGRSLSADAFRRFCAVAFSEAGITLCPGKEALVAGRVARRVRALGLPDAEAYLEILEASDSEGERVHFIDAISTNHTQFNREADQLEMLKERVAAWMRGGTRRLRLWSAASSTGEEAYSMAMAIEQARRGRRLDYRILATDIATTVLVKARRGVYRAESLAALDASLRRDFFEVVSDGAEPAFRVKASIRRRVVFRRLNLVRPPFPMRGPFHAIFCRNVMIYFDMPERQRLISAAEELLIEGGDLFVGHAESLAGIHHDLETVSPSHYRRPGVAT